MSKTKSLFLIYLLIALITLLVFFNYDAIVFTATFIIHNVHNNLSNSSPGTLKVNLIEELVNLKTSLVVYLLSFLLIFSFREYINFEPFTSYYENNKRFFSTTFQIYIFSALYVFPLGLKSMGKMYGHYSINPMGKTHIWVYRRILTPLIAHIANLDGQFGYFIFSQILVFSLIYLVVVYLFTKPILNDDFNKNNLIILFGLASTTFITFQFGFPGYVDVTGYILILLILLYEFPAQIRVLLYFCMLLNHETSVFIFPGLILLHFIRSKNGLKAIFDEATKVVIILLIYTSIWLASSKTNIISDHVMINGNSSFDYFLTNPGLVGLGILSSFKLFWLIPFMAIIKLIKEKDYTQAVLISTFIFLPLFQLPIGLDSSRLIGLSFPAFLISTKYLLSSGYYLNKIIIISIISIIIPPIYVGLNTGILSYAGINLYYIAKIFLWVITKMSIWI